ncbi:hypothetical protein ACTHQ2_23360, partial [Bacillus subtilis]|uniref:hypothetical protein n=1 Tax=Bacillus subtilis TaxID=1423 RepID=UPI003F7B8E81
ALRRRERELRQDANFHNALPSTYFLAIGRGSVLNLPDFYFHTFDLWSSLFVGGAPPGRA